jgi:xanthine dehydrogenase YagS FAD-binding subunit
MKPFAYARAETLEGALAAVAAGARPLAGGTELVNWLRLGLVDAPSLVDLGRLNALRHIASNADGGLRIGARVTLAQLACDALVARHAPALAEAAQSAASLQLRHRATLAGNLLQQTRCAYYRNGPGACNRREPGSGCDALHGLNEQHALFAWNEHCVATDPSDPAVALAALDAVLVIAGRHGERRLAVTDLRADARADDAAPLALGADELIVAIDLPPGHGRSGYFKVRERASYEFARVAVAASLVVERDRIVHARIALGGVANRPWRLTRLEEDLRSRPLAGIPWSTLIDASLGDARPLAHNGYKLAVAAEATQRLLARLAAEEAP